MAITLRQTLEDAELELLGQFREHLTALGNEQLRDILAELVEFEEVEDDEETGKKHPLRELQEIATTWVQLDNLMEQVREQMPEAGDAPPASGGNSGKPDAPGSSGGRKGGKHRHCCELGRLEDEAAAVAGGAAVLSADERAHSGGAALRSLSL